MPTCFRDPSSVVPLFLTAIETLYRSSTLNLFQASCRHNATQKIWESSNVHLDEYRDSFFNSYTRKSQVYLKCLCSSENILYPTFYLKQLNLATGRIYRSKSRGEREKGR
ncbi:LOW QUALITY PROTEIN: hypothetical protein TorRG33x02_107000 [Trema orientale]|uniref:Uncharacterized protein n=1 Tax=Trema orientale TaxID=63057 RepID=A0A2P5F6K5_TREOI|nr:LOW QUALITY PROTEIN: hypothetical protein TorRG33x02_107000 [Trema orientale]